MEVKVDGVGKGRGKGRKGGEGRERDGRRTSGDGVLGRE